MFSSLRRPAASPFMSCLRANLIWVRPRRERREENQARPGTIHMVAQLLPRLLTPGSRRPGRGTATRHLRRLADWVSYLARHGPPDRLIHYKYIHLHIYLLRLRRILGPMALAPHLKAFIKGIPDRRGERKDGQMQRKDPS